MNLADVQLDLRDVFGCPISKADIELVEKGKDASDRHYRAEVTAPGYKRDGVNLDFRGRGGLVMLMDPEQCVVPDQESAAAAMLWQRLEHAHAGGETLSNGIVRRLVKRPDRAWYECFADLGERVRHSWAWVDAPGKLHKPPSGERWWQLGSYKSREPYCSLQLVFWEDGEGGYFVEVDVDRNNRKFRHAWDALIKHPATGEPDSRVLAQLSLLYTGIQMGFEMRPKERAA